LISVVILLFTDCGPVAPIPKAIKIAAGTAANKIIYPDIPDFPLHYKPLFSFFEQHKSDTAFDTTISFYDQGFGGIDNYYNFVHAGHLFSKTQIHAVVFYDIADKDYRPFARMIVYKKKGKNDWDKVLEDSTEVTNFRFRYKDWNCDGINDLSYVENGWWNGGHGPISWWLWLIDKNGIPHKVKGFDNLDDPRIDSYSHHIFSRSEFHTGVQTAEYKFAGYRIMKISADMYTDYDDPEVVIYHWNTKKEKRVRLKPEQVIFTPMHDEDDD
jgi:hypothetical protein